MEYRLTRRIAGKGGAPHQFQQALRGVAAAGDRLWVVGDSVVKVFGEDGGLLRQWSTRLPGECVAVDGQGRVWVGARALAEIYRADGSPIDTWSDPERLGVVTAIGFGGGDVYLADATARWIRRYDGKGRFGNNIGDRHRKGGLHIPNGVVDFAVDGDGILHVANPGLYRVERYSADGTLLGHFGRFDGRDPAGFTGCCNPTNLTLDARGRVIVSEKAPPRVKVYDASGELLAVVADAVFGAQAKNMDVAVDAKGRIYVADTASLEVCVFTPTGEGAAA